MSGCHLHSGMSTLTELTVQSKYCDRRRQPQSANVGTAHCLTRAKFPIAASVDGSSGSARVRSSISHHHCQPSFLPFSIGQGDSEEESRYIATLHHTSTTGIAKSTRCQSHDNRRICLHRRRRVDAAASAAAGDFHAAAAAADIDVSSAGSPALVSGPSADATVLHVDMQAQRVRDFADALWQFTRPHTVLGTAISIFSVSLLALPSGGYVTSQFIGGLAQALSSALLMNVYIVGLNQLFDIDIDKVNKPYLPLASGAFSVPTGIAIVTTCLLLSVAIGVWSSSPPLLATLIGSAILGTAYSVDLPFLRWKRFPVLAAACILSVRAFIVQLGFFSHMQLSLHQGAVVLTPTLLFATAFMCTFSIVIALFKDIPDVDGDRVFGVRSLSVRVGQKKVYWISVGILLFSYLAAVVASFASSSPWTRALSVVAHSVAAISLWLRAQQVDFNSPASISEVYMFVWKLFYAEYLFIPLLR